MVVKSLFCFYFYFSVTNSCFILDKCKEVEQTSETYAIIVLFIILICTFFCWLSCLFPKRSALVQEIVVRFVLIDKLDNLHSLVCPESQHIKTNQQNILIRSLMLNDKNADSSSKDMKAAAEGPRKR